MCHHAVHVPISMFVLPRKNVFNGIVVNKLKTIDPIDFAQVVFSLQLRSLSVSQKFENNKFAWDERERERIGVMYYW